MRMGSAPGQDTGIVVMVREFPQRGVELFVKKDFASLLLLRVNNAERAFLLWNILKCLKGHEREQGLS